jgi:hypothetical protein
MVIYDPITLILLCLLTSYMSEQVKRIRLQKQIAYKYNGHPIYKYRLNVPSKIIENLHWDSPHVEVEMRLKNRKLENTRIVE